MKITLEIPKEFEVEYLNDKFRDTLARLVADIHCVAGNYEKETAEMLINAFYFSKEKIDVHTIKEHTIKHDEVKQVISELRKFSDTIFSFDPVTGKNIICDQIYLSDCYRVMDAIHLLQHYDDLLTVIRKE